MKVEGTSLKLFLTSGVTLTVKANEQITIGPNKSNIDDLCGYILKCLEDKEFIEFDCEITNKYKEDKKEQEQVIKHSYKIPYDKVSWFLIEEV